MRNNLKDQPPNFSFRELREKAKITREKLAARLNISSATLSRWEKQGIAPALTINEWLIFCKSVEIRFTELPTYFADFSGVSSNHFR